MLLITDMHVSAIWHGVCMFKRAHALCTGMHAKSKDTAQLQYPMCTYAQELYYPWGRAGQASGCSTAESCCYHQLAYVYIAVVPTVAR